MKTVSHDKLKSAAAGVFSGRRILAAYAYGSRINGRPRPDSDLDIGYYLFPPESAFGLPIKEEMTMAADLSAELGVDVDLRNLDRASLEMRGRILEEGIRIYSGDEVLRVSLERTTLSYYHDYKEVFRNMHEIRMRAKAKRGTV